MLDDPRIRTVLKRYPKGAALSDACLDLEGVPVTELVAALRMAPEDRDAKPRPLDDYAVAYFSKRWPQAFDTTRYDYFVHRYLRDGLDPAQNTEIPYPPEHPPQNIPRGKAMRWVSVRPAEDGYENWEAYEEHSP